MEKSKDNKAKNVNRLSIQVSDYQQKLINEFIASSFKKNGIFLNVSQVVRLAIGEFLERNKDI